MVNTCIYIFVYIDVFYREELQCLFTYTLIWIKMIITYGLYLSVCVCFVECCAVRAHCAIMWLFENENL